MIRAPSLFTVLCCITTLLGSSVVAVSAQHTVSDQPFTCPPSTIPNSNVTSESPCTGSNGTECFYSCTDGYIPIGRHVCQSYATHGVHFIDNAFFGGRCERLCPASASCPSSSPVVWRVNSTDSGGPCLAANCFPTSDDALRWLARSNWEVWRLQRHARTGLYLDHFDTRNPDNTNSTENVDSSMGVTGIGLAMECVAVEMGWQSPTDAAERVLGTLQSQAGLVSGFKLYRNTRGYFPTFVNADTGLPSNPGPSTKFALMATGLNTAGVLFVGTYFAKAHPDLPATKSIVSLSQQLFKGIRFDEMLCDHAGVEDQNGGGIPMVANQTNGCSATQFPQSDGYYGFNEEHYTINWAFETACGGQPSDQCSNKQVEAMWNAWQGRRLHPNLQYDGHDLLSMWSAYLVQLPFYMVHSFNSDPAGAYQALFKSHWEADMAWYASSAMYADSRARYGLGAGPTENWCAGGSYMADRIEYDPSCRTWSPYSTAGYIPASPSVVTRHVLTVMEDGEATLPIAGPGGHMVLGRKSLLNPGWNQSARITMVDFSSELFGLSTLWIGVEFWANSTDHWGAGGVLERDS